VHKGIFHALHLHHVVLEHMILKPNMVLPGKDHPVRASAAEIAAETDPACVPAHRTGSGAGYQFPLRRFESRRSDSQSQRHECRLPRHTLVALVFLWPRLATDGVTSLAGKSGKRRRSTAGVVETGQVEWRSAARRISACDGVIELTILMFRGSPRSIGGLLLNPAGYEP